jgi:hypothetical protein
MDPENRPFFHCAPPITVGSLRSAIKTILQASIKISTRILLPHGKAVMQMFTIPDFLGIGIR